MAPTDATLALLIKALHSPARDEAVAQFQALVWEWKTPPIDIGQQAYDILADLAVDLDYFEPDPFRRVESASYYGDECLEEEIKQASSVARRSWH